MPQTPVGVLRAEQAGRKAELPKPPELSILVTSPLRLIQGNSPLESTGTGQGEGNKFPGNELEGEAQGRSRLVEDVGSEVEPADFFRLT